ncbi:helix-turn-helix domain-containing protein [Apilactobacillus timberlakei]|uniref:helix-turn-helix domain-containing protein n=1 Tax=Apilactobacillus timberlakei TaxID=2008380 RepID=UPI00112CEDCA|nr:helix-turn-helix transcriptional regulator [Apilactobacillus timberlakei]TPR16681.1 XRE family transcriptional regulator [Apilactobacillus timberlakei]
MNEKMTNAKDLRKILADNLNNCLNRYGKNRADVSRDLSIPEATVRSWFNGEKYPRIDKLQMLADYFHVYRSQLTDKHNASPKSKTLDLKEAIDNDELMSYGGKEISPLEKEMVKRILEERDHD